MPNWLIISYQLLLVTGIAILATEVIINKLKLLVPNWVSFLIGIHIFVAYSWAVAEILKRN